MTTQPPHKNDDLRRLRIVVADDARMQRWLLKTFLTTSGHDIRLACDGEQAFRITCQWRPDLLITDLEMPGGDGLVLVHAIRHSDDPRLRRIPIIVCSSRDETYSLDQVLDEGANSFVTKPLHRSELQLAINNICPSTEKRAHPSEGCEGDSPGQA